MTFGNLHNVNIFGLRNAPNNLNWSLPVQVLKLQSVINMVPGSMYVPVSCSTLRSSLPRFLICVKWWAKNLLSWQCCEAKNQCNCSTTLFNSEVYAVTTCEKHHREEPISHYWMDSAQARRASKKPGRSKALPEPSSSFTFHLPSPNC